MATREPGGRLRALLLGLMLALAVLPAARGETVLRVAVNADLTSLDPSGPAGTTTYIHGLLVYDTLFAQDSKLGVHPQMVGTETVSDDRLSYTLGLRPGLRFHDGSPVTARDVVASLRRWMGLDVVGRTLGADVADLVALDDTRLRLTLKQPFPVEQALANSGSGMAVIMREKEAAAGPFTRDTPIIGSGPFRFEAAQWRPGDVAAYSRFDGYVPRAEPPDGYAGGKLAKVDRVELRTIPDAATKAAALETGEIDMIEQVPFDQADALVGRKDMMVASLSDVFNPFFMRPNSLYPPFDNEKARQALALAVNQADYMAVAFVRPEWGRPCLSYFVCGSPNGTTAGSAEFSHQDLARARQLLAESGYKGEKVVLLSSHEILFSGLAADLAAQTLTQIGLNIDVVESDWGSFMARRNSKNDPAHGGWNLFITSVAGSGTYSPVSSIIADTTCGAKNFAGWPCDAQASALRDAYVHEPDPEKQRAILDQLDTRLWQVVPTVILGQRAQLYAWRNNISGFTHAPGIATVFWNIEKK